MSDRFARVSSVAPWGVAMLAVVALAACTSSAGTAPATNHTASTSAPGGADDTSACSLVGPQQVQAMTGLSVGTPVAQDRHATTTCTYPAADSADSVIVEYQAGVSPTAFANGQQSFELKYGQAIAISGLGQQAYTGSAQSGGHTINTVVTLVGSTQIVIISSASQSRVERLAEVVLGALYARSPRGESSSSATSPTTNPAPSSTE